MWLSTRVRWILGSRDVYGEETVGSTPELDLKRREEVFGAAGSGVGLVVRSSFGCRMRDERDEMSDGIRSRERLLRG